MITVTSGSPEPGLGPAKRPLLQILQLQPKRQLSAFDTRT